MATAGLDKPAVELAVIYPAMSRQLAVLMGRIAATDYEIKYINGHQLTNDAGPARRY